MKRRELVSCSPERLKQLREAHEEFLNSELKKRLDEEWKINGIRRSKRPRIQREAQPSKVVIELGGWGLQKTVSFKVFKQEYEGKPGIKVILTF